MNELESHILTVKTILSEALEECEAAAESSKEAAAKREAAQKECAAAKERELEAIRRFNELHNSIQQMGVGSPRKSSGRTKVSVTELVDLAHVALVEKKSGLEVSTLLEEVRTRSGSSKRGFHMRADTIVSALQEDSRFLFDGRVWSLNQFNQAPVTLKA